MEKRGKCHSAYDLIHPLAYSLLGSSSLPVACSYLLEEYFGLDLTLSVVLVACNTGCLCFGEFQGSGLVTVGGSLFSL